MSLIEPHAVIKFILTLEIGYRRRMQEYRKPIRTFQLHKLNSLFNSNDVRECTVVVAQPLQPQNKVGKIYDDERKVEYVPYLSR